MTSKLSCNDYSSSALLSTRIRTHVLFHYFSLLLLAEKPTDANSEQSKFRRDLDKVRLKIGRDLHLQKKNYELLEEVLNVYKNLDAEKLAKVKMEKMKTIFMMPEDMIPSLFCRLNHSQQPRKFRKTPENPIGFRIVINSENDYERLNKYEGFVYGGECDVSTKDVNIFE